MSEPHRMVFVGGAHRSGTTVLAKVMAASSEIAGLVGTGVPEDEGQHLQTVLPIAMELGGPTRWALHPEAHEGPAPEPMREDMRRSIEEAWEPYWSSDAALRVEKSPPNVARLPFLQSVWPDARFIVITRHPLIQALAVHKWDRSLPMLLPTLGLRFEGTLDNWFAIHEGLAADAPGIRNLLVLRYEHLMRDPERELGKVSEFLGLSEPLDASMIDAARSDAYRGFVESQRTRRWGPHPPVMSPTRQRSGLKWSMYGSSWAVVSRVDSLTGRYSRIADRYEDRARALGYSMHDLDDVREFVGS
ncbi:sulfotransferase family protein [Demequina subtropica]|uniref:sulfotransferase family protein n=1 Tax=Demequina subtropica TaxID=1638989 RepID=UPI000AB9661A|nr:sulfotransferase [Demequina subtropica]